MLQWDKNILLVISFVFSITVYLTNSLYAKKVSRTKADYYFFLVIYSAVAALTIYFASGGIGSVSLYSVIFGIIFGVVCMAQTIFNLRAFAIGPFAYTTILVSLSTVIPTLAGAVLSRWLKWDPIQNISVLQWIGIVLMIVCIALSPETPKDEESKKISAKWFLYSMLAAVFNGLIGVFQTVHQNQDGGAYKGESTVFLLTAFAVSIISAVVVLAVQRVKHKGDPETKISCKFNVLHISILVFAGISIGICHVVNLFLSGVMESAILFPIINICPLIVTTALAMMLFKERLSLKRWIGIAIGIVSMICISGIIG